MAATPSSALAAVLLVGQPRAISMFPQRLRFHRMLADLGRTGGRSRVDLFAVLEAQPGCDEARSWRDLSKLLRAADTLEDPKWRPLHASIVGRRSPHVNATIHYLTAAEVAQALAASPHSYFFQFFKVALAFRLVERAEQARGGELYRLLFRTRTDLIFSWPLPSLFDESAASSAQLSSLEQSAVRNWTIRPTSAWLVHDWAWLAGRDAAAVLASSWQQMGRMGLLRDDAGEAQWRALAELNWTRVLRSAWATRASNFLLCAPYPTAHLRQHPAGKGKGLLSRSLRSTSSKVLEFWAALPAAIAAANAAANALASGRRAGRREVSYLRDCWWHTQRAGRSDPTMPLSSAGANPLLGPLLEPEVALGLALFRQGALDLVELDELPRTVVGVPAICPPGC